MSISARIDALAGSRRLWTMIAILSFGAFFEIYDIGLTAPLSLGLLRAGIFRGGAGGVFGMNDQASFIAATFLGLYLGTIAFSGIADRFGRRAVFTWSLLWYALATVTMGFQSSAIRIDVWRLIASIGVGVELVAIDCYIAELMPARLRGRGFAVSAAIQFLAAPAVAILAVLLIPGSFRGIEGWRWLCFVPAIGAILIWLIRLGLPESPRWLATRGRIDEASAIVALLEANGPRAEPMTSPLPAAAEHRMGQGSFADLWDGAVRRRTILMIVFHTFQVIGYFGFANWLPTLLVAEGITVTKSLGYGLAISLSMPLAPLLFIAIADRFERKWQIAAGALAVAAFGLCFASLTRNSPAIAFIASGLGIAMSNNLMSYAYHAYQSEIFPTAIRARAVGFVYSFSRLAAILSGYMIAFILARAGTAGVFLFISGAMVIVAITIALWGPRTGSSPSSAGIGVLVRGEAA